MSGTGVVRKEKNMRDNRRMKPIWLRTRILEVEIAGFGRKPYSEIVARVRMIGLYGRKYQLIEAHFGVADLESAMKWAVKKLKIIAGEALMLSATIGAEYPEEKEKRP